MFQEFPENNKDDDFLNEFRQKLANQSNSKIEEKQKELQRSKSVFLGAVAGVGLACVVGWFALTPKKADISNEELPVIRQPQAEVKIKPDEPGGMEILNQDKTVYNIIDKSSERDNKENILPPPEEPKTPEISPEPETISDIVDNIEKSEKLIENIASTQEIIDSPEAKTITISEASQTIAKEGGNEIVTEEKKIEVIKIDPKKEAVAEKAPEPLVTPKAEVKTVETPKVDNSKPTVSPAGTWQVQLMSSKNKDAVEKAWKDQVSKYSVLANQPYEIEAADIDFEGTFYRLKAGAFTNKADADKLCSQIKAAGGSCLVKKK